MFKFFARLWLKRFAHRYGYDVSYMEYMLSVSPSAFSKFSKLNGLASHQEAAPRDAIFAAKLVGAIAEDCGPCVQLVVNMAREAGVEKSQINAVLIRDLALMNETTALGFLFADAIVGRAGNADEARERIRDAWGEAGVIDITLAAQIGRIFPMVKKGLGFAKTCQKVSVDNTPVEVVREAA
ncbi:MAG: hypothetical protein GXP04_00400 [Alphaproteobacteria bacterium]|nr:hypothetical protein [Alphaproteobacteria bacterium]